MIFDPLLLAEDVDPRAVERAREEGRHGAALAMALRLNETGIVRETVEGVPLEGVKLAARAVGPEHLERLLQFLAVFMDTSPHVEFYLRWCLALLEQHGQHLARHTARYARAFRAMHGTVKVKYDDLRQICDENSYTLGFVEKQLLMNLDACKEDSAGGANNADAALTKDLD
uniref:Small-subunit processome Utp12 domain-containing protein n=1 Tax=Corethron hystrix TaxID=216773 RepID=A0A7S1BBU4_9STRA